MWHIWLALTKVRCGFAGGFWFDEKSATSSGYSETGRPFDCWTLNILDLWFRCKKRILTKFTLFTLHNHCSLKAKLNGKYFWRISTLQRNDHSKQNLSKQILTSMHEVIILIHFTFYDSHLLLLRNVEAESRTRFSCTSVTLILWGLWRA